MLTQAALDAFARDYYLATTVPDHRIENRLQRDAAARILSCIPAGARVLELGHGDGLMTAALRSAGIDAELLEGSPLLCARADQANPGLPIHCAMFETFTPRRPYDAILALHVLEHVDDPVSLLRRLATWLRPGGTLVIVVPNRASMHRRIALSMRLITALDDLSPRDHLVGHRRVYDLDALRRHVATAGLVVDRSFGAFLKTLPNSMMLDHPDTLLTAIDDVSASLPPEMLANIGLVARRPHDQGLGLDEPD